jgi:hypothetical protein
MLAEIFLVKMESILRASMESASADNSRFVPITLVDQEGLKTARPDPERAIAEPW